jgi:CRISPR/Cas system-associated protein Cas5 (RAMP superfamily)
MNPDVIDLINRTLPVISAILGAIVGATVTIIITIINKRSEEKRQIRELSFKAGIENWKGVLEIAKKDGGILQPLDYFLIHMRLLSHNLLEKNFKVDDLKTTLKEIDKISNEFVEYADKKRSK